jgi:hypothetical protein
MGAKGGMGKVIYPELRKRWLIITALSFVIYLTWKVVVTTKFGRGIRDNLFRYHRMLSSPSPHPLHVEYYHPLTLHVP